MLKNTTRISLFFIAIFTLFLLSSCKANMITDIKSDGSGLYTQEIGFTADEINSINSMGGGTSLCDSTQSDLSSMPANTTKREEKRGDETWCVFEAPFTSLDELRSFYGNSDIVINDISLVDNVYNYDVTLDTGGSDFSSSFGMINMKWIVKMPGKVTNHNADEVDGSKLTWNLAYGQTIHIYAESKKSVFPSISNTTILIGLGLLCLCILMLVLIVVVVFLLVRKNKANKAVGG